MAKKQRVPYVVRRIGILLKRVVGDYVAGSRVVSVVSEPCQSSIIKEKGKKYFTQPTWIIKLQFISETGGKEIKLKKAAKRKAGRIIDSDDGGLDDMPLYGGGSMPED